MPMKHLESFLLQAIWIFVSKLCLAKSIFSKVFYETMRTKTSFHFSKSLKSIWHHVLENKKILDFTADISTVEISTLDFATIDIFTVEIYETLLP
jgi:hypothetical protein